MLLTPRAIEQVSSRIERAYLRRRSLWRHVNLDPRIWSAAVAVLFEAHRIDPRAPLDPELFVACVASERVGSDPWTELTRPSSVSRYLSRIRRMIRQLRREIQSEICRIHLRLNKGESLEQVLIGSARKTTALSRYLVALREDREDLADLLLPEARHQHWSCPLYRDAVSNLFPEESYPVGPLLVEGPRPSDCSAFSLN